MISAFVSYSSRYRDWVATLHSNLELCFERVGTDAKIFFDQKDLPSGSSWVGRLEQGIGKSEQLILVLTPEALASPWVTKELRAYQASRGPTRPLHVVHLVDTPAPPFLSDLQWVDFRRHDKAKYCQSLTALVAGLCGRGLDDGLELSPKIRIPSPPAGLADATRAQLIQALATLLTKKMNRRAVETVLNLERNVLEEHPSSEIAAAVALVLAIGDDEPLVAARRLVDVLIDDLEVDDLQPLRDQLATQGSTGVDSGLLAAWLRKVATDHERLVPYFQQRTELALLDRVYVQLQLSATAQLEDRDEGGLRHRGPRSVQDLLTLDPAEHTWVTRRWMVLGDPGSGKTTLLRHLAAALARQQPSAWVPIYESLPRLMREPEWLLERIERQMRQAGEPAEGLPAVLDRAGQEGRLLLLLDGLDEVPRRRRDEADALLGRLARRWPQTPLFVTSRPIGYHRPAGDFVEVELLPFDRERRREFLARWFGRQSDEHAGAQSVADAEAAATALEQDPGLRDLASNPLYLTLMALLIEQGTSPDRNRTRLYDQVFKLLLRGEHRHPPTPMERPVAVRRMLCHLGYAMTRDNLDAEPIEALEERLYEPEADAVRADLERVARWRPRLSVFLDELAESSGILGPHDGPESDWRYWHRTFREALAAEALDQTRRAAGGEATLLEHARKIAGSDLSRWAEPYALLTGRVDDPDALVRALVDENRELGLRALATAQSLRDDTVTEVLDLSDEWEERQKVYERLPELIDEPSRVVALLDVLRQRTRNGNDLYFLEQTAITVAAKWPDAARAVETLRSRFYDHIPAPPEELFRRIDTAQDGRVDVWREIPVGEFLMGSPEQEEGGYDDERPQHRVNIGVPFRLSAVSITNGQYEAFDPNHKPQEWEGVETGELPYHPVVNVTWYEAVTFCRWLATALPWAIGARLPIEEEWEYACRAGTKTRYWSGDGEADLERVGWYGNNSDQRVHRVAEKSASPWGLYDMHGNVWEWTLRPWSDDYEGREDGLALAPGKLDLADPVAPTPGAMRVFRGGGYWSRRVSRARLSATGTTRSGRFRTGASASCFRPPRAPRAWIIDHRECKERRPGWRPPAAEPADFAATLPRRGLQLP